MNKTKILIFCVAALLVSNLILAFLLMSPKIMRDEGPKKYIIQKLHFDEAQCKLYEIEIQQHRKEIHENEKLINKTRNALYFQLKYQTSTQKIDSLTLEIAQLHLNAERINFRHFLKIKQLCKPEQINDFNDLTEEIAHLFSPKHKK